MDKGELNAIIQSFHKEGFTMQDTCKALRIMINQYPDNAPNEEFIIEGVNEFYMHNPRLVSSVTMAVIEWLENAEPGEFHHDEVIRDLGLTEDQRPAARKALQRLAGKGIGIERAGKRCGMYRKKDESLVEIDYRNATGKEYPIVLPFNLHDWVKLYPKAIIIIAGTSNAGKSAFCLNVIRDNMDTHKISHFSSEFSADDLKVRLENFGIDQDVWKFKAIERSHDFHDVVDPDGLNIIDYLEVPEGKQPYEMNQLIDKIFRALNTGIALIALQKRTDKNAGVGGEGTIERARLAINMDRGNYDTGDLNTMTIRKAKSPRYHTYHPNCWQWQYKLLHGTRFEVVTCNEAMLAERELRKYNYWEGN